MAIKFGALVVGYCVIAVIIHCLFIAFAFLQRGQNLDGCGNTDPIQDEFEIFIVWTIIYFPLIIFCAFYTLLFRMCRSFLCSCWQCCGQNIHGKGAVKCKICFEGVFGNPLIFAIIYIIWGIYEWIQFKNCKFEIQWGFLGDLVIVSISLLLLCIYYFVRIKRKFEKKRNQNIAKQYQDQQREEEQIAAYNEGGRAANHQNIVNVELGAQINNNHHNVSPQQYAIQAPPNRLNRLQREGPGQPIQQIPDRRYSAQPIRQNRNGLSPAYAASANNIAPYQPEPRRHSYNPNIQRKAPPFQNNVVPFQNNMAPAYAASAQGAAPYRPQNMGPRQGSYDQQKYRNMNPLMENVNTVASASHQAGQESASIEISVDLGDDDDDIINTGHRTRGPSISFPSRYKGHARRVSSGILTILKKIDAEPECAVCMGELEKGDEMGQLECGHTFHKECIVEWLGNEATCPMCRDPMTRD